MSRWYFFHPHQSAERALEELKSKPAAYWERKGERMALRLFHYTARHVPAYRQFLKQHHIAVKNIRTTKHFCGLPSLDKNSYIKAHNLRDLLPRGDVSSITTFSSTSGSTGEPTYFPRGEEQDWQYEYVAEIFLRNQFEIAKRSTLAVIGFALGIWIGGIFTYKNFNAIARKGYPLALAPAGTDKDIFLTTVKKIGHHFDQIILMGYPPFLKDLIDEAHEHGVDWSKYRVKVMTATEGFSEKFREHVSRTAHLQNMYVDTLNIYGTVELGTMAHETALSNLIRHIASQNPKVFAALFPGTGVMPTLTQYHPYLTYFEEVDGELFGTGFGSSYPLIRYRFFDKGRVIPFDVMQKKLDACGVDLAAECKKAGIQNMTMKLPFVAVFERSDYVVVLRGANIYPQNVRNALLDKQIDRLVSGRFTMRKCETPKHNAYLEINVELKKGVASSASIRRKIAEKIITGLRKENSEFNYLYTMEGAAKVIPHIRLYTHEHPKYFTRGIKQKWVAK